MQGFIDGIGPLASMPRFLSVLGVQLLRSVPLRQAANKVRHTAAGHASAAMPCLARLPPRPASQSTSAG